MRTLLILGAALTFTAMAYAQNDYTVSKLVTSQKDSFLKNPWGLSRPVSPHLTQDQWWVSDQLSGVSTLYDANGDRVQYLVVEVPPAQGSGKGSPTGTTVNPANNDFTFATLDGTISVWNPNTVPSIHGAGCNECHTHTTVITVNHAAKGASYQGLTIAKNATSGAWTYYAANNNGGVEAYDATTFEPVTLPAGAFTDPAIPSTYAPAGIQAIGTKVYVTYNRISGGGTGYVDAYDTNGARLLRLEQGWFNQPWGVVRTPADFGLFSDTILVGNTGSGWIGAYNSAGVFQGFLNDSSGGTLTIPGLWALVFGNGSAQSGPANVLYYTAGGASQTTGVFGTIKAK